MWNYEGNVLGRVCKIESVYCYLEVISLRYSFNFSVKLFTQEQCLSIKGDVRISLNFTKHFEALS